MMLVHVEADVRMASDHTTAAWSFDLDHWGRCGQGSDEPAALAALATETGRADLAVAERITGDERTFDRDHLPATAAERAATLDILAAARRDTVALLRACPDLVLDHDDPDRVLPAWATWRTLRQMAWHLVDTESRYYLPALGLPSRPARADLAAELVASAAHVRDVVSTVPADLTRRFRGEVWTTTKLLRRLAWHERAELVTMRLLAARARAAG